MGILDLFKRRAAADDSTQSGGDTETVQRIVDALGELPQKRARLLAGYAYLLGRVAYADRDFQPEEADLVTRILQRHELPKADAELVVDIVKRQNELFGGTEDYLVTREYREVSTREQRLQTLDCLFAVAAADEEITGEEEAAIAQIANELGLTHREVVEARLPYSDKRSVLK